MGAAPILKEHRKKLLAAGHYRADGSCFTLDAYAGEFEKVRNGDALCAQLALELTTRFGDCPSRCASAEWWCDH